MAPSSNLRGALFMAISMVGFAMNDTITKSVSVSMNAGQMMFIRGVFATLLIGLLAWRLGALKQAKIVLHPTVGLRMIAEAGGTVCFLAALAHMPLANVSAVMQALPLAITMGAAFFMGEPVGWRRWSAIGVGLVGVLIVVRPGFEGFSAYSFFALASVLFCTLRDLVTRRMPKEIPTLLVSTVTAAAVTVCGGFLVAPFGGWSPLALVDAGLLAGAAALLLVGYQFIIMSMREGDISFIAPFRYTALLWSIFFGFLVFGDIPDTAMVAGACVIVCSGLYSLYREQVVGKRAPITNSTRPAMAPDGT